MTAARKLLLREWTPWSGDLTVAEASQLKQRAGKLVDVDFDARGTIVLRPGSLVGRLHVEGFDIYVQPKVKLDCLLVMLSEALDLVDLRSSLALDTGMHLEDLVVLGFLREVGALLRQGLHRAYVATRDQLSLARGRIEACASTDLYLRGISRVVCQYEEYTIDTQENRVLAAALRAIVRNQAIAPKRRAEARQLEADFLGVDETPVDVDTISALGRDVRSRHYRRGLGLAELILRAMGFHERYGTWRSTGFLVDMNKLFEAVVARRLAGLLAPHGFIVRQQHQATLDVAGTVDIRPDVVVRHPAGQCVVVDAKYKTDSDSAHADLYQMVAYCRALGATDAVLVDAAPGLSRTLQVRDNVVAIHTLHVDLRTPSTLDESLAEIASRIHALARPGGFSLAASSCGTAAG